MSSPVLPGHLIYSVTFNSPGLYSDLNFSPHRLQRKASPHTKYLRAARGGTGGLGGPGEDISSPLSFLPDLPFLPACSCLQAAWADCGVPSLYIYKYKYIYKYIHSAHDKVPVLQGTVPQRIMAWFPTRLALGLHPGRRLERARTDSWPSSRPGEVTLSSPCGK